MGGSRKTKKGDINENAFRVMRELTGQTPKESPKAKAGREGGKKGGKARAEKMTAKQRSDAARMAANARWNKGQD